MRGRSITHGTTRGAWSGCKCTPCRAALNDYNKARVADRKQGGWRGGISADKVRAHLMQFDNLQCLADVLGVGRCYLWRIREGQQKQVRPGTEKRILAVDPKMVYQQRLLCMRDTVRVPKRPTMARVRRLQREGFTYTQIARKANVAPRIFTNKNRNVTARTEMRVEQLYNRIMAEAAA